MNNHLELAEDLRKEFKVDKEGKCTCTIRGTARLLDLDHSTLVKQFRTGEKNPSKLAQKLIDKGFDPMTFSKSGVPDTALMYITKHYAYHAGERCTKAAQNLDELFAAVGVRSTIQQSLGWKKKEPRQFNAEEIRWLKIRESGVHDRKCFASAISRWIETNNIQGSKRKTIYADATNRVYYQVTHLTSKELMERPLLVLGSDEDIIRNRLTDPELLQVEIREKAFAKLMYDRDYQMDPLDAIDLIHLKVLTLMGSMGSI